MLEDKQPHQAEKFDFEQQDEQQQQLQQQQQSSQRSNSQDMKGQAQKSIKTTDELTKQMTQQEQVKTSKEYEQSMKFDQQDIERKSKFKYDKNCELGVSWFSKITFYWTGKILEKGEYLDQQGKYLQNEDMFDCRPLEQPLFAYNFMEKHLIQQIREHGKDDLEKEAEFVRLSALEKLKRKEAGQQGVPIQPRPLNQRKIVEKVLNLLGLKTFLISGIFAIIANLLQFAGPILLNRILDFMDEDSTEPTWMGYMYASLIFISYLLRTFLLQHAMHLGNFVGVQVLNGLSSSIFTKILRVSSASRKYFDTGKTMNLVSVDSQTIFQFIMMGTFLMSSPFMIVASMALIIAEVGPLGLITPVFFVVGSIVQQRISLAAFSLRRLLLQYTDKRSKAVNEFFEGIRVVKYYAWEEMVSSRIFNIRKVEMENLMKSQVLKSAIEVVMNVTPLMMSTLVFGLYSALYSDFTSSKAYTLLSLFNLLLIPLRMLTMVAMYFFNAKASMTRIEFYLTCEEAEEDAVIKNDPEQQIGSVQIADGNFSWDSLPATIHNEQGKKFMRQAVSSNTSNDNKNSKGKSANTQPDYNQLTPIEEQSLKDLDILKSINFQVSPGETVAIVGQVAAGKSSLLQALLGEMIKTKGIVKVKGKTAYIPQTAWLQNATLRDNILFGEAYDDIKYNKVIDACQLRDEISNGEVLPGGDLTEIGERGINLSGGQKQRVAIARALYADADIYLIDDCLSALDAHVGKNVFDQVILKALEKKTVILVTHALHYMPQVQRIVVMKEGEVIESGSHEYLLKNGKEYIRLNQSIEEKTKEIKVKGKDGENNGEVKKEGNQEKNNQINGDLDEKKDVILVDQQEEKQGKSQEKQNDSAKEPAAPGAAVQNLVKPTQEMKSLLGKSVQIEERATGAVPMAVYGKYINFSGIPTTILMLSMYVAAQGFKMMADWWIGQWSDKSYPELSTGAYIGVYAGLSVLAGIFIFLRGYTFGIFSLRSSGAFQQQLLKKLLHTPLSWFDITPTARIVARTSKDQDDLDSTLPWNMEFALTNLITLIATCIMISVILPLFLVVFVVALVIYVRVIKYYLLSAREIKRIEANMRAPVISAFQESINGLYVIRAFNKQRQFVENMLARQRDYVVSFTNMNYTNRWISVMTDLFALVIISGTAYFGVLSKSFNYQSNSSLIGLALSWSFSISSILSFTLKMVADTESGMNAVVRMLQYIDHNPQENSWREQKAPEKWPSSGQYAIENVTYKYREELPQVINGISFNISKGEKIGVVGRTGSGKSTMTLGLMRILELAMDSNSTVGTIKLDDVNIRDIGLHELREKVTIIPQDPLLFTGTVRSNIDPFNKHSNGEIAEILKKVEIWDQLTGILEKQLEKEHKDKPNSHSAQQQQLEQQQQIDLQQQINHQQQNSNISNNPNLAQDQMIAKKLDIKVDGGGANFSLGQRQLICIARAIIKKPKVLLMDEATASIDEMTDKLIQYMIKKELQGTTVITIAHRLKTIIQYDKILVLDLGNLKEFDTPLKLLNDTTGYFNKLITSHGSQFFQEMKKLAANKDLDVY